MEESEPDPDLQNYGMLPPGHEGSGKPAHLFTDEILVQ